MSRVIDEHFYNELLLEKKVKYYSKIYISLFNKIWPSSENFIGFLLSSSLDLKINYARKIYENLTLINDLFLPPFTISNVLYQQLNDLKDDNKIYFPQDHVIHSVNLYILGVYIFFNSDKISRKLISSLDSNNYYSAVKKFILKWQLFAFYHDVGYFFENKKEKIEIDFLEMYKSLFESIVYHIIVKDISKAITYNILADRSTDRLKLKALNIESSYWYDLNDVKCKGIKIVGSDINEFEDTISIDGISNDEEFMPLLSLLNGNKYLVVVYNEFGENVALLIRKNLETLKFYAKSLELKNLLFINNYLNATENKFKYKYYIKVGDNFWGKAFDKDVVVTQKLFDGLPKQLKNYIQINDDVENILYTINNWVNSALPLKNIKENEHNAKIEDHCYKESLINIFTNTFTDKINKSGCNIANMEEVEWLKNFVSEICDEQLIQKIENDFNDRYGEQYGKSHEYVQFFKDMMENIMRLKFVDKDKKCLTFYNSNKISPFNYDKQNVLHKNLYRTIEQLSKQLNIDFKELKRYKPIYNNETMVFDHGVASACLLFKASAFIIDVQKNCHNVPLALAWNCTIDDEFIKICAESIFAVLLHNVYCKKSKPDYGIEYQQDFGTNTFSYFCAFCDNIQKWGRPKQLDYSKTAVPHFSYLEDEFDIHISNDIIYLKCKDKYINHLNNFIKDAESFLPGITELIKIEQYI